MIKFFNKVKESFGKVNKYFVLVALSIFIIPISGIIPVAGVVVWYPQYLTLFLFFNLTISIVLWKFNKYISIFSIICLFNTIFVANQHPRAMLCLFQVNFSCLAMYGISLFNKRQRKILLNCIFSLILIQSFMVILQYFNIDPIFDYVFNTEIDDTVGFSGSHNQIGLFFSSTGPIVLSYFYWFIPIILFGIWCSTTQVSWIAFIIAGCFYYFIKNKKLLILFLILCSLGTYVFYNNFERFGTGPIIERVKLYKHTISQIENGYALMKKKQGDVEIRKEVQTNKWFGFGLGNFIRISPHTQKDWLTKGYDSLQAPGHVYAHVHNDFIESYFELGRIGFISLLLVVLNMIFRFIRANKTKLLITISCCLLAFIINANGIFTVQTALSGMLLIIFLGIFEGEVKDNGKAKLAY